MIPARLYDPQDAREKLIVYLHGGMWVLGDLETHHRTCRLLAAATSVRVLAVDFRRAPERRWPAAIEDALERLIGRTQGWGRTHRCRLATARADTWPCSPRFGSRDCGRSLGGLLVACPNTDLRLTSRSIAEFGHGWSVNVDSLRRAVAQWLPLGVAPADPAVSPLLADLAGLPPAVVISGS